MSVEKPQVVHRRDYRPPDYRIDDVELDFDLREDETFVRARLAVHRDPTVLGDPPPLVLVGQELETLELAIDGSVLAAHQYAVDDETLEIAAPPERFTLETLVRIHPERNTALSGLYRSSGNFCTQCEANGFRRITWFLDRPDVMARYAVRMEADRARYPVLLSNGNRIGEEALANGRHAARWRDPSPKPSYLFALVAGNLLCHAGTFTTRSGRAVRLEIWVEPQNIDRCEHALRSLERAMRWDEQVFGLEYELDVYMIVAVGDFNMGAMENKGLNIFNAKYVLAAPETATDDEYEAIEAVIGHEYFHNWTGNRVTCRDWFQLTLKEGLTVFRDQQFTADQTSPAVKRIRDVVTLRTNQFPEDAGPMAHPIRPESYISMDNFYTATVYEKGAEVVRLYHTLFGADGFRRGMDLYFERHDGQAVTCDDFRAALADANGADLAPFERWYAQAGTPRLAARGEWDRDAQTYTLHLAQSLPKTGATPRDPLPIPVRMGLLGADGRDLPLRLAGERGAAPTTRVLVLEDARGHVPLRGDRRAAVPSLLRGSPRPSCSRCRARAPSSRSCSRTTPIREPLGRGPDARAGAPARARRRTPPRDVRSRSTRSSRRDRRVLDDPALDGSLRALMLALPNLRVLGEAMAKIDYAALFAAREFTVAELARAHRARFEAIVQEQPGDRPYRIERAAIDRRRLRNTALRYLAALADRAVADRIEQQFARADNMTDRQAALQLLVDLPGEARDAPLAQFYEQWRHDPLVLDKWFTVQALSTRADTFERVAELARHPDFTLANPNRVRALVGSFAQGNPVRFHAADGRPYAFLGRRRARARPPQSAGRRAARGDVRPWRRFPARSRRRCARSSSGSRARSRSRRTCSRSPRARSRRGRSPRDEARRARACRRAARVRRAERGSDDRGRSRAAVRTARHARTARRAGELWRGHARGLSGGARRCARTARAALARARRARRRGARARGVRRGRARLRECVGAARGRRAARGAARAAGRSRVRGRRARGPVPLRGRRDAVPRARVALPGADARHARDAGHDDPARQEHGRRVRRLRPRVRALHGVRGRVDRARPARLDAPRHLREARDPRPPGASVYDAESRCTRLSRVFEKRAACIEAEGFERLAPTPR
jgi:aminopeptidase N